MPTYTEQEVADRLEIIFMNKDICNSEVCTRSQPCGPGRRCIDCVMKVFRSAKVDDSKYNKLGEGTEHWAQEVTLNEDPPKPLNISNAEEEVEIFKEPWK